MSILRFENVSYSYPGSGAPSLREVSLSIEPGEFCVVAGLSGSGKSTLLRAACGLVPHFHGGTFAGTVLTAGLDTREHTPAEIGAHAGTLLADPETQVVMASVRAEIAFALENRGIASAAVARTVEETALALGVADLLDRSTDGLSGGELQRVALAGALAAGPELVLLDEPTSQLDPVAGDELIWQLRRLNQECDTAVVLVEQRLERCLAAADRVLAMSDGAIACDRDPGGFLAWAAEHAPALQTPGARAFAGAGLRPLPSGVKQARAILRRDGLLHDLPQPAEAEPPQLVAPSQRGPRARWRGRLGRRAAADAEPVLQMRAVWHELREGPAILRGVDLRLGGGEAVVLMGRNGAGKSTLLRHAGGLMQPTRGRVQLDGELALLLQNPGDLFIHEHVCEEASADALRELGLGGLGERNPRDLSSGQRQRLALAVVLGGQRTPQAIALDEPTRGMDRGAKQRLAGWLSERAREGALVLVATHDCEFAVEFATRAVLLARGRVIADGPVEDVLGGGRYFTTETARILGRRPDAVRVEQAAALLRGRRSALTASGRNVNDGGSRAELDDLAGAGR
jgi:energy-coupling factor transport system ATP-binding protein